MMDETTTDPNGLTVLPRQECLELLASHTIGRISTSLRALPVILPVTYVLEGLTIYFRTGTGTKFHAAGRKAVVAFEVDRFDEEARTGWSVLVVGEASAVEGEQELAHARTLPLDPWIPTPADRYVQIPIVHLSGRRLVAAQT